MTMKECWKEGKTEENPFGLPQTIAKEVKACARAFDPASGKCVKYLWLCVSEDRASEAGGPAQPTGLSVDEWLGVVDEGAALGAECLVIGVGAPLGHHPEVAQICRWAQAAHEMMVGLHIYRQPLTPDDVEQIKQLDPARTRVFVDRECMPAMRFAEAMGLTLHEVSVHETSVHESPCSLPGNMICIGSGGNLYTCGLVLGDDEYGMGHFFDRKLEQVMADGSLPHSVPQGTDKMSWRCGGCPSRLAELLHGKDAR